MVDSHDVGFQTGTALTAYRANTTLRIREHVPPEPFTGDYGPNPRPQVDWTPWRDVAASQIDRLDFALANPPLETERPAEDERVLTITGHKTRRTCGGAQVVTCFLDGDRSIEYVAKIYDGVDYPLGNRQAMAEFDMDCMTCADRDYSIEAWAYRIMQPVIGGTVVPAYHGSWTFALDTHRPGQQRWVRMIIIELVQGECMLDVIRRAEEGSKGVDYTLLPTEPFRLCVLQNILEAKLKIWWDAAITHNDLSPRNVMAKPDGSVVIIDFNQVLIDDFIGYDLQHPRQQNPDSLPPTPIEWLWPLPSGFANGPNKRGPWAKWIPQRWLEDQDLAAEWLVKTYRDSPRFRPPTAQFLNHPRHARRSERVQKLLESLGRTPAS
jgi:hypothetical protein